MFSEQINATAEFRDQRGEGKADDQNGKGTARTDQQRYESNADGEAGELLRYLTFADDRRKPGTLKKTAESRKSGDQKDRWDQHEKCGIDASIGKNDIPYQRKQEQGEKRYGKTVYDEQYRTGAENIADPLFIGFRANEIGYRQGDPKGSDDDEKGIKRHHDLGQTETLGADETDHHTPIDKAHQLHGGIGKDQYGGPV